MTRATRPVPSAVLAAAALLGCDDDAEKRSKPVPASAAPVGDTAAEPPAPAPSPPSGPVASASRGGAYAVDVLELKHCPSALAAKGSVRLGVLLRLRALEEALSVDPLAPTLHAGQATHRPRLGGCEPGLLAEKLAPGTSARGWVTFEVPKSASDLELRYRPFFSRDGGFSDPKAGVEIVLPASAVRNAGRARNLAR